MRRLRNRPLERRIADLEAVVAAQAELIRSQAKLIESQRETIEKLGAKLAGLERQLPNDRAVEHLAAGQPVISVDCKKKELVGDCANDGRKWETAGQPRRVGTHGSTSATTTTTRPSRLRMAFGSWPTSTSALSRVASR